MNETQSKRRARAGRAVGVLLLLAAAGMSANCLGAQAPTAPQARELLNHGEYKAAISAFQALLSKDPSSQEAQLGLAKGLTASGDYSTAESKLRQWTASPGSNASLQNALGEVLLRTGRYSEAEQVFERASNSAHGEDWLRAILGEAKSLIARGQDQQADTLLQQFVAYFTNNDPRSAAELTLIAQGMVYIERFRDANSLYQAARQADSNYIDAYIGQGNLLNEKYNYGDAASLFSDALKINSNSAEAHLGLAESKRVDSSVQPQFEVDRALKTNPNFVDALELKAELELEEEHTDRAAATAKQALAVNPNSTGALAVLAAISYLGDDKGGLDASAAQALNVNPKAGSFYDTLAHFAVINRRYTDAVAFEQRAVELSPHLWSARTELGIELLRIGKETEGRAQLEQAFQGDPFNVWAKNTLDLLDSMRDYRETEDGPFIIKSAPKDAGALSVYAGSLLETAYKRLTAKYHFTPQGPITVELFPNHDDFAVRSLGLPGLGALGVCFGKVIAMDSPSARPQGEFNWGSTLWHEFTHVITLQMTDHRIPRWFSEGLSVYEERHARAGWGDKWSIDWIQAYNKGEFVKIADIDAAFTRPKTPQQVPLAYFQASLICDFVEQKFGFDSILKMLSLYKDNAKTPAVLQQALGLTEDQFDRQFDDYVKANVAAYAEAVAKPSATAGLKSKDQLTGYLGLHPKDYFGHVRLGDLYESGGDSTDAAEQFRIAISLFPLFVGKGNPYMKLAGLYEKQGQKAEEVGVLDEMVRSDDTPFEALKKLAALKQSTGDLAGALDDLRQAFYVYPFDASLHKLAGDIYLQRKNAASAVREYQVAVALGPADAAGAHYDAANALAAAGREAEARREVLKALEIAPEFPKAQDLLLKLSGAKNR